MAIRKRTSDDLTGKTCKQVTDLVLDYLTDKLSAGVKRSFERHLANCPDCVSFLKTYKKAVAVTKAVKTDEIPARVRDNVLRFLRKQIRRVGALLLYIITQATS
jgi:anti-sigma factor RsiW